MASIVPTIVSPALRAWARPITLQPVFKTGGDSMFATTERVARLFGRNRASACCRAVDEAAPRPRAMCEELESRQLMSAASVVGSLIPANVISPALAGTRR